MARRALTASVAAALLALTSTVFTQPRSTVAVFSWNVAGGQHSTNSQIALINDRPTKPHVIYLEEVPTRLLPAYVANILPSMGPWHHVSERHCRTWSSATGTCAEFSSEHVLLMTRMQAPADGSRFLPGAEHYHQARAAVFLKVSAGKRPLYVFGTHLSPDDPGKGPNRQDTRAAQVTMLKEWASTLDDGPRLMVGDFNSPPPADAGYTAMTMGYQDVWKMLWPGRDGHTFPANGPVVRIDFMFSQAGSSIRPQRMSTVETKHSDHLALEATFTFD